jgi:hypothetical protein
MKTTVLGALLVAAATAGVVVSLGQRNETFANPSPGVQRGAELVTIASPVADNRQQLTVIDPLARVMSVYHIDVTSGAITLKSVRNIHWDLQMSEFNGVSPLPREIRALLEQR